MVVEDTQPILTLEVVDTWYGWLSEPLSSASPTHEPGPSLPITSCRGHMKGGGGGGGGKGEVETPSFCGQT